MLYEIKKDRPWKRTQGIRRSSDTLLASVQNVRVSHELEVALVQVALTEDAPERHSLYTHQSAMSIKLRLFVSPVFASWS